MSTRKTATNNGFLLFKDQLPILENIPDENLGEAIKLLLKNFDSLESVSSEPFTVMAYELIATNIRRYREQSKKAREDGLRGGSPTLKGTDKGTLNPTLKQQDNTRQDKTIQEKKIQENNNIDNKPTKTTSKDLEDKLPEIIKNLNLDEEYVELTKSWIKYKRDLKEGYKSEFSLIAFVKRLAEFSNNQPEVARRVIEQSFERNWKTVYKLQENSFKGKPVTSNEINYKCDFIQPDGTFYNPYL